MSAMTLDTLNCVYVMKTMKGIQNVFVLIQEQVLDLKTQEQLLMTMMMME